MQRTKKTGDDIMPLHSFYTCYTGTFFNSAYRRDAVFFIYKQADYKISQVIYILYRTGKRLIFQDIYNHFTLLKSTEAIYNSL